jgi:phenylpropionate dioxygenase-like ring-hydroxylating dioxygenase large terminal subunit
MIPNQWYAILESNEIRRGKLTSVTRMGEKLVAWRDAAGAAHILGDRCPHRGAALSAGKLLGECIQCPFHGFEFNSRGECTLIPANGRAATPPRTMQPRAYETREAHGLIYIWWGEPRESYPPLPFFDNLPDQRLTYVTLRDPWPVHYTRAIENQLDVVHLPFVHYNTIGAGGQTLVHGPIAREQELAPDSWLLEAWMDNEIDHGQAARKPSEMPEPRHHPMLQFYFPNIWQLWIGGDARIFVAFAPVDENNTMLYVRQYHGLTIPGLRVIADLFGLLGSYIIIRQDKRVVVTQRPIRSELKMDEVLIPGDLPIIYFRKRRQTLKESAAPFPQ